MSDFKVEVKVNDKEIRKILGRLKDVEPPLKTVARKKLDSIQEQFNTQTDPDGNPWAALMPSTLRSKKKNRDKILTREGNLAKSFQPEITRNTLRIFTTIRYAGYHQYGTSKMEQRKILGLTNEDWGEIRKQVTNYVKGKG